MSKRVRVGRAFTDLDAQVTEVIEAETRANESKARRNLAYCAVVPGTVFLVVSAAIGIWDSSFDELQGVWNVLGPIVGAVFGHYFGGLGKTNGDQ